MSNRVQLSDTMQTTCPQCGSIFRLSTDQLDMARGQVRCGECMHVFNALLSLENFTGEYDPSLLQKNQQKSFTQSDVEAVEEPDTTESEQSVSLKQAMYGDNYRSTKNFKPLLWIVGILLLIIIIIVQAVYYQRYSLISSKHYQQQILNLCQILPCDESRFAHLSQIKLLERNIFTHPTRNNALMVSGSFVNKAPFSQPVPKLLISLSDTQGNYIANRLFNPDEYLSDKTIRLLIPGKPIQFRLEIYDPGSEALAYEFEFYG